MASGRPLDSIPKYCIDSLRSLNGKRQSVICEDLVIKIV